MNKEQEEQQEVRSGTTPEGTKRKLEDPILLAKQKAQEIAARLVSNAESKRPRLDNESSKPSPTSISASQPTFPVSYAPYQSSQLSAKKISIPNAKVGLIIGKGGETIRYLVAQSGAKIQITKDSEADPYSLTRDVELTGTSEQISRAEQLINETITQTDAGSSATSANHGLNSGQTGTGAEQIIIKVPNNKVALIIGKGGETIRYMQSKSGARIQIIPLHLPPGDTSTERNVYVDGSKEQIDSAQELITEVMSGKRIINPSGANSYIQPAYTSGSWGPPGQSSMQQQQPQYQYAQPGTYVTPPAPAPAPAPAPYYSSYPTQVAGWDQSNQSTISQQPQQSTGYDYYSQQAQVGSAPPNSSYGYTQTPPVTNNAYDQNYSQQPPNYGQTMSGQAPAPDQPNQYPTSGYGQPPVSSNPNEIPSSHTSQPSSAYPPAYSQPMANPQAGYWAYPSGMTQMGYDQSGYYQTVYGGQQPDQLQSSTSQPGYGQAGYSAPAASNYTQAINPPAHGESQLEQQSQQQKPTNGFAHSAAYGVKTTTDASSEPVSTAGVQDTATS